MNHFSLSRASPRGHSRSQVPHPPPDPNTRPKKLRRISRACDFCHKRSIRCTPSEDDLTRCQNCLDFAVSCTYLRPAKKRGIKSGGSRPSLKNRGSSADEKQDARMLLELTDDIHGNGSFNVVDKFLIPEKLKTLVLANEGKIRDLIEVYFEVVYPIFPLFHGPTLIYQADKREYLVNHSFFADIMALCALASARVRDGALFPGRWNAEHFKIPAPEFFFTATKEVIPRDLSSMRGLDWMRTCAMLALYGIQVGKIEIMHEHLGMYHSLIKMDNLHDEKNWPKSGLVEIEIRRRLFWSMYTLDVYSSIVWGGIIAIREFQCDVHYPGEVDDAFFNDHMGYHPPNSLNSLDSSDNNLAGIINPMSWLHGWNYTTELYRILEHAMDDFHRRRPHTTGGHFSSSELFPKMTPHQSVVLGKVMAMQEELPARFKEAKLMPQNGSGGLENKFGFQAANITATLSLVRMVLFTSDEATVNQKCTIARELLDGFAKVPVFFLRAISSPLLHQLAGIGGILGSLVEGPLSEPSYLQVREVLLAMADLLASLEAGFNERTNVGAASRLRNQVVAIDNFMANQRQAGIPIPQNHLFQPSLNHEFPDNRGTRMTRSSSHQHNPSNLPDMRNATIDPSLQSTVLPIINSSTVAAVGGMYQTVRAPPIGYGANGVDGTNGIPVAAPAQFHIPPELLDNWPWPAGGFAGF